MDDLFLDHSRLPAIAFAACPTTGETVAILRGRASYYHVGNGKSPDDMNRLYGVTTDQARAMLVGVLHGWDRPLNDISGNGLANAVSDNTND